MKKNEYAKKKKNIHNIRTESDNNVWNLGYFYHFHHPNGCLYTAIIL